MAPGVVGVGQHAGMNLPETRVIRVEDRTTLTVGGRFVDDLAPADTRQQVSVRPRVARGEQHGIETTEAHLDLPSPPERVR
jgi:hypothetical protein